MKAVQGVQMSYRLHEVLRTNKTDPIRGLRVDDGHPVALNTCIYSLVRSNRNHRRDLLTRILKLFDTPVSLFSSCGKHFITRLLSPRQGVLCFQL